MNVCTIGRLTKCVVALVYYIDPGREECGTYPGLLFGRSIVDDAA